MKIAFDAKRAFANKSGLGNYSRDVIRNLSQQPDLDLYLFSPVTESSLINSNEYQTIIPEDPIDKAFKFYWRSFSQVKEVLRLKIDLYHGLSNEIPLSLKKACKTVVTIHDLIFKRYPEWYPFFDRKIYDWKFKNACINADTIIAVSEQTKQDIIDFYNINPDKIKVVYQTCNAIFKKQCDTLFKEQVKEKYHLPEHFILNVGTIEQRKNAFEIVKAIHQHAIDVPLFIVGRSTDYAQKIQAYIKEHQLENKVFLLHNVNTEELSALYQMADVFIYPSTFEGFGIPIIEALYSRTPVITTKGGCFSEPGGDAALYLESINPQNIADALNQVLSDKDLAENMVRTGTQHVQKFNADTLTQQLLNVYKETLGK